METISRRSPLTKRPGRRLLTAASAVSLALCMSLVALRVRQHYASDSWGRSSLRTQTAPSISEEFCGIESGRGRIRFAILVLDISGSTQQRAAEPPHWSHSAGPPDTINTPADVHTPIDTVTFHLPRFLGRWGLYLATERYHTDRYHLREWMLCAPVWLLVVMLAVLPAFWTVSLRRRQQQVGLGLCISCGYDLRATPGRCPECGVEAEGGAAMT